MLFWYLKKEEEINQFVETEYWKVKASFEKDGIAFDGELDKFKGKKIELNNEEEALKVYKSLNKEFIVEDVKKSLKNKQSKPPFITSTLQQEASSKLNFKAKKTMMLAQKLYEGVDVGDETVGLITYMRTDSTRLSDVFVTDAKNYINETYGKSYVGSVKSGKKKENVQDAHEAIRPTNILRTPESLKPYLSRDEMRLYKLIYARALASLMAPAKMNSTQVVLENNGYTFKANGSIVEFDGYLKVYKEFEKQKDELLPELEVNEVLVSTDVEKTQHFTKPPARYSEAKLIKELEELGIGRPSTYATIIDTIVTRNYVELVDKTFKPTESGILTNNKLVEFFDSIINVEYTALMEKDLDLIAEGQQNYVSALSAFEDKFEPLLEKAYDGMEQIQPVKTGETCPDCGADLVIRKGRYGDFVACSSYPTCKYIKKEAEDIRYTGEDCPKCGSKMIFKKGKFGEFEACSSYPTCKHIKTNKQENAVLDETCPNCGKPLTMKRGRYGLFKACSGYPECKTIVK